MYCVCCLCTVTSWLGVYIQGLPILNDVVNLCLHLQVIETLAKIGEKRCTEKAEIIYWNGIACLLPGIYGCWSVYLTVNRTATGSA